MRTPEALRLIEDILSGLDSSLPVDRNELKVFNPMDPLHLSIHQFVDPVLDPAITHVLSYRLLPTCAQFDEGLWIATIDAATVHSEHEITFKLRDCMKLDWKI